MTVDTCKVLMIFPRFNTDSFWNHRAACELTGARYPAAPLGLITVAAEIKQRLLHCDAHANMLSHRSAIWSNARSSATPLSQRFARIAGTKWAYVASPETPVLGRIHRDLASEH